MNERQLTCLSLMLIATFANYLASVYITEWREYWFGIATAATLTSYLYKVLTTLVVIRRHSLCKRSGSYMRRVIEVSE